MLASCLVPALLSCDAAPPAASPPPADKASAPAPLRACPVYTSFGLSERDGPTPAYPLFDVVVPLAPEVTSTAFHAADWQEAEPGRATPSSATRVRPFEETGYGLSVILALDVSGSMRGRSMQTIRTSVGKFVGDAQTQDRVSVMTFADEARWDVPFTAQSAQVHQAIDALAPRGHETHLYDAMLSAIDRFDDTMPKRRVLIVMSDGHDEGSIHTLEQVIAEANARHISINTIGIANSDLGYLKFLKAASESTGGGYATARSDEELDGLLSHGIAALKQTPVVTFRTLRNDAVPQTVSITINWLPKSITAVAELTTGPQGATGKARRIPIAAVLLIIGLVLASLILYLLAGRSRKAPPVSSAAATPPGPPPAPPVSEPGQPSAAVSHGSPRRMELNGPPPGSPPLPAPSFNVPTPNASPRAPRQTRLAVEFTASPQKAFALFKAVDGPLSGRTIPIDRSPFTIGAADDNLLPIAGDPTLSGHHARLSLESSILFLDDLSSTNGSYINGVKLAAGRRSLAPGDELRLGRSIFHVLQASAKE